MDLISVTRSTYSAFPKQFGAFALISVGYGVERKYLLQWNRRWQRFNLIGGKQDNTKGDNHSLLKTIQRELEEELGLKNPEEFKIIKEAKQVQLVQFSQREKRVKEYFFAVFEIEIFPGLQVALNQRHQAARWLSTCHENTFASIAEIRQLYTKDGKPISLTTWHILNELGELPL